MVLARQYYLRDHLGSVRVTINEQSQVIHHDDYYPFGAQMPGRSYIAGQPTKETFTGHELDDESGFYYAGARYLDPVMGRWNAVDPLFEKHLDWTPYNYVLGNPLYYIDPDGRQVGYHMAQAYRGDWSRMRRDGEIALGAIAVGASLVPAGYVAQGVIGTVADALTGGVGWSSALNWIPGLGKADEVGDALRAGERIAETGSTGTVWDNIIPTQPNYPDTILPKSFALSTDTGVEVWVHGNGTKHIADYIKSVTKRNPDKSSEALKLVLQQELRSLQAAVNEATKRGVLYDEVIEIGGWELKFGIPRDDGLLPALIHARVITN